MTKRATLEKNCPLCGGDNQCAIAAGQPASQCWCQNATISADALAAIPPQAIGKYCLCPACGQPEGDTVSER